MDKPTVFQKLKTFLDTKTGTILLTAVSMSIGFALKDFIHSFVINILQPLVILIINTSYLNKFYNFSKIISHNEFNVINFISSAFTLFFIVITVYFIHNKI